MQEIRASAQSSRNSTCQQSTRKGGSEKPPQNIQIEKIVLLYNEDQEEDQEEQSMGLKGVCSMPSIQNNGRIHSDAPSPVFYRLESHRKIGPLLFQQNMPNFTQESERNTQRFTTDTTTTLPNVSQKPSSLNHKTKGLSRQDSIYLEKLANLSSGGTANLNTNPTHFNTSQLTTEFFDSSPKQQFSSNLLYRQSSTDKGYEGSHYANHTQRHLEVLQRSKDSPYSLIKFHQKQLKENILNQ